MKIATDWERGYASGLRRAFEIAKDYTGQGVLIASEIEKKIVEFNAHIEAEGTDTPCKG